MLYLNLTYFFFTVAFTVIITVLAFLHNQLQSVFNSKNEKQLYLENKSINLQEDLLNTSWHLQGFGSEAKTQGGNIATPTY